MILSENALNVLKRRYLHNGENVEGMFRRVANHVAQNEKDTEYRDIFYGLMTELKFLPNSPTLMNAGLPKGQLAACFVLPIEDSMDSIFQTLKDNAIIQQTGGGAGFSFSNLRPKNSKVGVTNGVASGPVSFMGIYDVSIDKIRQGNRRRGSGMSVLSVTHPDILDFIKCKSEGGLSNFNISITVTDKFIDAVRNDNMFELIDPHTQEKTLVKATDIWREITEQAWKTGDPGVVFIDKVNKANPTPGVGKFESTNPCVSGDTWVLTDRGARQVKEIIGEQSKLAIDGYFFYTTDEGFFKTGFKKVFNIITKDGYELKVTDDHEVKIAEEYSRFTIKETWKKLKEVKVGDKIVLSNNRGIKQWDGIGSKEEGFLLGLMVGDGHITDDKGAIEVWGIDESAEAIITEAEEASLKVFGCKKKFGKINEECKKRGMGNIALRDLAHNYGIYWKNKYITDKVEKPSFQFYTGFLRGLFDADGTVIGRQEKGISVRLSQSNLELLKRAQRMLHRMGIISAIYQNRRIAGNNLLPDGNGGLKEYYAKACHELVIANDNMLVYSELIGFSHIAKQKRLDKLVSNYKRACNREMFVSEIESITEVGEEDVYDVKIPNINAFDANGFFVHNCGEQPLLPYEACNLGSINLSKFVDGDRVNYDDLKATVHLAVRFLDDVIDTSYYPLPQIDEMVKGNRKIGLGIMGFADMLYKLKIPYDSEEGLALATEIMEAIQVESKIASRNLAKERGSFPNIEKSIYKNPIRNATTTTIAPTGTLSIIADCSSGIEPLFALSFEKNVMDGTRLIEVNKVFEQVAKERGFYSKKLMESLAQKGSVKHIKVPADIKKVFVTAHDIAPEWHVKMQAAFQKYVDNAISKTVNLPQDATVEDVDQIYNLAFDLGCKGITIYRDGSKENQVLSTGKKERPETLEGFTTKIKTGMGHLYVTITEHNGKPFEVFATIGKSGKSITAKAEVVGRLTSLALRSGVPVEKIIEQLKGISGEHSVFYNGGLIKSIPDAVGRVLEERYVKEKVVKIEKGFVNLCPECGKEVTFQEGCLSCHFCGYSKCG